MRLSPCGGCRRHIAVGEAACPFCGARTAGLVARQSWPARMSRAAIFTSTALAMPACGGGKHAPEQTVLVAPTPDDAAQVEQVARVEPVDAGSAPTPPPIDAAGRPPADAPAPTPDAAVAAVVRPTTGHAKIYGTLRDANGHAAVGWPIELYSGTIDQDESIGGQPRSTTTDGKGAYAFTKLPAGTYTIVLEPAQTPRSSPQEQQVTVTDRQSVRVDGKLYPPRPCCMPYGAPPARRRTV